MTQYELERAIDEIIDGSVAFSGYNCNETQRYFLRHTLWAFYHLIKNSPPAAADTPSNDSQSS